MVNLRLDHALHTTVKLDNETDIRELISVLDFYTIVLGMVASMYHNGYDLIRTCKNNNVVGENGSPLCNYIVNGKIDPMETLLVNRHALNKTMLSTMAKKLPNSVGINEVKHYQRTD
jgi:hypothetical protein